MHFIFCPLSHRVIIPLYNRLATDTAAADPLAAVIMIAVTDPLADRQAFLMNTRHPRLVEFIGCGTMQDHRDPDSNVLFQVLEYMSGGDSLSMPIRVIPHEYLLGQYSS